jgi:Holliday junction resolvase RusA-like endonuclease
VAEQFWPTAELPVTEPVMLTITYFYEETAMDVDNIPKPISDALKGLVYVDDSQVNDVLCRRRDLSAGLRIIDPSPVLAAGFDRGVEFLHIAV